jgi:3-methyladenine DNA glycosylase AlkC
MAEILKNVYNRSFYNDFVKAATRVVPGFNEKTFVDNIFNNGWDELELKERMRHTSIVLNDHLSGSFEKKAELAVDILYSMIDNGYRSHSLELMFFPDFIEHHGLDNYQASIAAFEKITQITSCEFGVRPYLLKYPDRMIKQMLCWSEHDHPQVRRLASEGSRPRLPWAMAIPYLKEDPGPIVPILDRLKNDEAETVRRSVANSLNDIAKDNPKVTVELSQKWIGKSKEVDWVVKHACRTLLKQGHNEAMKLFGFGAVDDILIEQFEVLTPEVKTGGSLEFRFNIVNSSCSPSKLRVEYGLYYMKANGSLSKKVFMISEKEYREKSVTMIRRNQSFKPITTRKFHNGKHLVSIIINGIEFDKLGFLLK